MQADVAYIDILNTLPADLSMPYPIATATGNWHFSSLSATAESIAPDSIAVDSS